MTAHPIERLDTPLTVLEKQLAEVRAHAVQRLTERGTEPSPELLVQWHDFLDIDPDLRGRDYSQPVKPRPGGAA